MTSKAKQRIRHNSQHTRRFLRHKLCGAHRSLVACLKLLVDLPGMLDFLRGLLEGAGNSLVGGPRVLVPFSPDHLIQFPLRPCREWFMVCIAEGYRELLQKFTRTMHHCGGRAKRRSTRMRTDRMVRIRVRGRGRCRRGSTIGVYRDGGGSRSTRALLSTPPGRGSCCAPGPGTSRRSSRGGDSSGMYQVEDVSSPSSRRHA